MSERKGSPNYGGRLGHAFFHWTLRLFGLRPAYLVLAFIVPYYVLFRPSARRSAAFYLRRRFPHYGTLRRWAATVLHFYGFGQSLIDQAAVGILGPERLRVDFPGDEEMRARARSGRGLILLTSHAGSWQGAMANMKGFGTRVHFQFALEEHTAGRHFFDLAEKEGDFRIISPTEFLGGMVEMTHALTAGECVAVMGDRAWEARVEKAPFLGREAAFPITAYHLASVTGADLVTFLTVRTGPMAYRIETVCLNEEPNVVAKDASRGEVIRLLLGRYVDCLERYVEKHPFMWFNFFDFWAEEKETRSG